VAPSRARGLLFRSTLPGCTTRPASHGSKTFAIVALTIDHVLCTSSVGVPLSQARRGRCGDYVGSSAVG
jgi:hypothetical protein